MNRFAAVALLGALICAGGPVAAAGDNNISAQRAMLKAEWAKARARHAAEAAEARANAAVPPQAAKTAAPAAKAPGS